MRFQEQSSILKKAISLLAFNITSIQAPDGTRIKISNIDTFPEALKLLDSFSCFENELKALRNYDVLYNNHENSFLMTQANFNTFNSVVKQLRDKVSLYISIVDNTIVPTNEKTVCIKLIEYDSMKDIADELEKLDKIILQVITHKDINCSYKFSSFDIGSSWIYITIESVVGLHVLAGLVWAACVIRKKWNEGSILEKTVEAMKIKNESLEDIKSANKILIDELTNKEAENLMAENNLEDTDNEYKNRLIHSITDLSKLINDGVQIHPSLMAPEDSRNLFPDYSKLDSIESKTKLLEHNKK